MHFNYDLYTIYYSVSKLGHNAPPPFHVGVGKDLGVIEEKGAVGVIEGKRSS